MSGFEVTSRPHKQPASMSPPHLHPFSPIISPQSLALRLSETDPKPPRIPNGSQLLVTRDSDSAYFVDLSNSTSPAAIKERIYAKLGIYDDEHATCRISRARAGQPVGLPLDDWQLWDLCMRSNHDSDPPMLIVISQNHPQNPEDHPPTSSQLAPPHHASPIPTPFSAGRRASTLGSNTPFEIPVYLHPRPSQTSPENPDDCSLPSIQLFNRHHHGRRPSEPVPFNPSCGSPQPTSSPHTDPRTLQSHASAVPSSRPYSLRPHPLSPSAAPTPTPLRRDLLTAKSMEDLRLHGFYETPPWALPGATHPPLPASTRLSNSASRAPPPLRIPRNNHHPSSHELATQRSLPPASSNPSSRSANYPSSLTPSFPFPQPAPLRGRAGAPGYGPRPSSSSDASVRSSELRLGSSRQLSHSAQLQQSRPPSRGRAGPLSSETRYLDQSSRSQQQRPPDPSPHRLLNHPIDCPVQVPLATQPHIQLAVSHPALQTRPGDRLHDAVPQGEQRRERLREFRGERDGELGIRRRPMTNPKPSMSASLPSRHRHSATGRALDASSFPPLPDPSSSALPNGMFSSSVRSNHRTEERSEFSSSRPNTATKRVAIGGSEEDQISTSSSRCLRRPPHQPKSASQASSVMSSDSSLHSPLSSRLVAEEFGERAYYHHLPQGRGLDRKSHTRRPNSARSSPSSDCPSPATEISVISSLASHKPHLEEIDLGPSPTTLPEDLLPSPSSHVAHVSPELDSSPDPPLSTPTLFAGCVRGPSRATSLEHGYGDEGVQTVRADDLSRDLAARFSRLQMEATVIARPPPAGESLHSTSRSPTSISMSTSTGTWRTSMSSNPTTACSDGTGLVKANNPFGFIDDEDEEEMVGTFLTPMLPAIAATAATPPLTGGGGKPKLTLNTDTAEHCPSAFLRPGLLTQPQNSTGTTSSSLSVPSPTRDGDRRTSFTGDDWAVRPAVDEVYEHLEEFFPHHDLDKPIDIGPLPPSSPLSLSPSPRPLSSAGGGRSQLLNGRARSIRVVAQEKKKLLRRTELLPKPPVGACGNGGHYSADSAASGGSALLRRKSTKLWGARIEEVTPGMAFSVPSPIDEHDSGLARDDDPDNFSFKWVKGELIGKGSFGQVYLALNATNGEMLAVKQVELPKTRSDRDDERQKSVVAALKSEIHLMRDLEHPNIVQYLGFEETTVYLSIFLEYIPGGSIGRCLRRHGAFELNVIKSFTFQILEGLKYLHSLHILHRDLKADNLLVDLSGNCKISDFGISKKSDNIYEDNTAMSLQGSIFWMAPEVVHNPGKRGYSAKVDIWSLGCVVLEMFAGRRPWSDEEAIQAMFKLGAERLRPPVPADVKLGRMSDHFLAQCFIVDPDSRPTADRLTDHRFLELENKSWRFEDSELYRSIRMPVIANKH